MQLKVHSNRNVFQNLNNDPKLELNSELVCDIHVMFPVEQEGEPLGFSDCANFYTLRHTAVAGITKLPICLLY